MNIAAILRERARDCANTPAIVEGDRSVTFAELDCTAASVAGELLTAGITPGDRALVFCPMSIALYATLVGLWRVGAVAVVPDPSAGREYLARCCQLAEPRALIATPRAHVLRLVSSAVRRLPIKLSIGRWVPGATTLHLGHRPSDGPRSAAAGSTPALITFTSGSTGQPKAAVRSHDFLLAQHRVLADDLRLRRGQRDLTALPIFVLANLASGVTSIIPDVDLRRPDAIAPARLLRQIRQARPTRVAASPALLERLGRHAELHRETITEFDEIYTGGAPVFPRLLGLLQTVAPAASVVAVYGSTEAEPIARIAWSEMSANDLRAMESGAGLLVGRPVTAIDLRVLTDRWGASIGPYDADSFDREALPATRTGEIVVAGEHVLTGYLGGRGDAETKFQVDGRIWHRTGDAGYLDSGGRLWLLGRCSAKLQDEHGILYPFAAECAAQSVDGVRRCATIHQNGRRVLIAELDGLSSEEARRVLMQKLAWARLEGVIAIDRLPMDKRHNAKIDYRALRQMLEKHHVR